MFLGLIVWIAGVAVAAQFGHWIEIVSSIALVAFGLWIAGSGWSELQQARANDLAHAQGHAHHHDHDHKYDAGQRTALLLILGSSPMIEGLPAFFAAGKYGLRLIAVMSLVFGASTILTYVVMCVAPVMGMQRTRLGAIENYGEVLSGLFIAAIGVIFWLWTII